jgi:hypothetical protein
VASYLSGEWFEQLGAAAEGVTEGSGEGDLVLQHTVTGGPAGDVWYHVRLAGGVASIARGQARHPDVSFSEDYATAAAVASGELSASAALLAGRIRVRGDMTALIGHHDLLAVSDPVPAALRATTTYR